MARQSISENTLFYGDNLPILREYISDENIDLIYLDPPFNSSRNYNVLFKDEHGAESEAQITAFEDTWHWEYAEGRILLKQDGTPRLDGLKIYLDETKGRPLTTNWTDIERIGNTSGERSESCKAHPLICWLRLIARTERQP